MRVSQAIDSLGYAEESYVQNIRNAMLLKICGSATTNYVFIV